jgi:hypothetical protein
MAYASKTFSSSHDREDGETGYSQWVRDFSASLKSTAHKSHEITSLLSLLSSSLTNGQPLPPYLRAPKPFQLAREINDIDPDILSISHLTEPGYAAFAVMQVASTIIIDSMESIISSVRDIVGEVDFTFHVISTADSVNSSGSSLDEKEKQP